MKRINLVKFRLDHNLKSKDMAQKLDISVPHYSNLENRKADPTFGLMLKFEREFKGKYDDIWFIWR